MFTTRPVRAAAADQIGLARQERRNLQDVNDLGDRRGLRRPRGCRSGSARRRVASRAPARADLRPGRGRGTTARRAVGLVVRRLEDERHAGARARYRERQRRLDGVRLALDDARPGDEHQRPPPMRTPPASTAAHPFTLPRTPSAAAARAPCAVLASTNPANSGCGLSGFDLNSGWNCTATYHGCAGSSTISTNLPSSERPTISRPFSVERLLVQAVELVAVAVALVDHVAPYSACAHRARRAAGTRTMPSRIVPPRSSTPSRSRSL